MTHKRNKTAATVDAKQKKKCFVKKLKIKQNIKQKCLIKTLGKINEAQEYQFYSINKLIYKNIIHIKLIHDH